MARCPPRRLLQMIAIALFTCVATSAAAVDAPSPSSTAPLFQSVRVVRTRDYDGASGARTMVEFEARGRNLNGGLSVRTTSSSLSCSPSGMTDYEVNEVWAKWDVAHFAVHLPREIAEDVFFCLPKAGDNGDDEIITPALMFGDAPSVERRHQGPDVRIPVEAIRNGERDTDLTHHRKQIPDRKKRYEVGHLVSKIQVKGLRLDHTTKEPEHDEEGIPVVLAGTIFTLRLFGTGFSEQMVVTFTHQHGVHGSSCQIPITSGFAIVKNSLQWDTVQIEASLPYSPDDEPFFICVKVGNVSAVEHVSQSIPFVHQGSETWIKLKSYKKMLPLWAAIVIVCTCLSFSALFSGLNLGLMSLDRTELKILCNTGTEKEKQYAKQIQPIRNTGNYLLCSILLGNVLVNSIFTILLDDLTSGLIAVIFSTMAIVMFGEITPQAICSRHGLAIGAKTIIITKMVMAITFPLSYPISKILDVLLGEEIGSVYTRERLKELVKVTTGENDLDRDEINIISGALELSKKTVADVMTKIEDAFMLDYEAILDFETVSEIMKSGYSRIPVFKNDRTNIVTTLYIKDLAFVDPDDNTPLKTLCQFYNNPCNFVYEDVTLDIMFKDFKEGNKGHMAFVNRVNNEGDGDPFYETIGLITLEDVIEELIQAEIVDETDVFTDNRTKRRRNADRTKQDFTVFAERRGENNRIRISPQLTLATFQYLSTSVELFKPDAISETILRRLLKQDIIHHIKKNKDWRNDPNTIIYQQSKAVDYFVLILEGRVEVTVGQENLMFESGPFTYFGTQALMPNVGGAQSVVVAESPSALGSLQSLNMDSLLRYTFQPDYSVRACTEVLYMKVKRNLYMAAKRASLMEKSQRDNVASTQQFDDEVEKLLHSLEEDGSIGRSSPELKLHSSAQHNDAPAVSTVSLNASPRTPSLKSHLSPTALSRSFGSKEVNGAVKQHSGPDDDNDEEEGETLLPKKS